MQRFLIQNYKVVAEIFFYSMIVNLLQLVPSMYMLQVFDRIFISQNLYTLAFLTIIAIYLYILSGVADYFRSKTSSKLTNIIDENYLTSISQDDSLSSITNHDLSYQNIAQLKNWFNSNIFFSLFDIFWVPFFIFVMYVLHPLFGYLSIILLLVYVVTAITEHKNTQLKLLDNQTNLQENNQSTLSFITHHELFKPSGFYKQYYESWQTNFVSSNEQVRKNLRSIDLISSLLQSIRQIIPSITIFLGAYLVIKHDFSMPVMIVASILISRVTAPVESALKNIEKLPVIFRTFNSLSDLVKSTSSTTALNFNIEPINTIQVKNLSIQIDQKIVVHDFNASFETGNIYAISGKPGSGKSLLLKLLAGMHNNFSGEISVNGKLTESTKKFIPQISYFHNSLSLLPANIVDNITCYEREPDTRRVHTAAEAANAHSFIVKLPDGYNTVIGDGGRPLSVGQAKRIFLSQTLYRDSKIILIDQPESHLDDMTIRLLSTYLSTIKKNKIIIFTGNDNHLLKICDARINL